MIRKVPSDLFSVITGVTNKIGATLTVVSVTKALANC